MSLIRDILKRKLLPSFLLYQKNAKCFLTRLVQGSTKRLQQVFHNFEGTSWLGSGQVEAYSGLDVKKIAQSSPGPTWSIRTSKT